MSAAPYWGQLPDAKTTKEGHDGLPSDHGHSVHVPSVPRRARRNSIAMTDSYTDTTFSPHTPLTPSFGLAPRPLSIHRGPDAPPQSMPRPNDQFSPVSHPAAGPDPRGPPVTYRAAYSNGDAPYSHPSGPPNARPRPQPIYQDPRGDLDLGLAVDYVPRRDAPQDSYQRPMHDMQARVDAPPAAMEGAGQREPPVAMRQSERRRNMTKEEKRARVEAAEQRARQRAAGKTQHSPTSPSQQTPADDHYVFSARHHQAEAAAEQQSASPRPQSNAMPNMPPHSDLPSQRHPIPLNRDRPQRAYNNPMPPPRLVPEQASHDREPTAATFPQRNLSFRERASTNDPQSPNSAQVRQQPFPNPEGYPPPLNTNMHKVRKEPPRDFEYRQQLLGNRSASGPGPFLSATHARVRTLPVSLADKQLAPAPVNRPLGATGIPDSHLASHPAWASDKQAPPPGMQGIRRHVTEPVYGRKADVVVDEASPLERNQIHEEAPVQETANNEQPAAPPQQDANRSLEFKDRLARQDSADMSDQGTHNEGSDILRRQESLKPGHGLYKAPEWLNEWKRATTGLLSGTLLDLGDTQPTIGPGRPPREMGARGLSSTYPPSRRRRAEAFDGEYNDANAPTRFKPPLYLSCGPLLRYRGIRRERFPTRSPRGDTSVSEREIWRGSIMIVTKDSDSSYEISPTLRLFVQQVKLLPPPPHQIRGETPPEYVDPIAGHPKLGRSGETLYVRPVEDLDEARDHSLDETNKGIFETANQAANMQPADSETDCPGSFTHRRKAIDIDGEKMQKFKDVRGFRLHIERGCTFWRFNIEVELRDEQQRIAYRINRGPPMGFWVPPRGEAMNIMFYSCNGFSPNVKSDELSGPDPMWRDVLNSHQSRPFHVMIGGGDQIYNDRLAYNSPLFDDWLEERDAHEKRNAPFSAAMQDELEAFYLERYCTWFSQGLFGLAVSQIPMVNMYDNHDVFDGYGSYPHLNMASPVFCGLGAVAFKYYMLFQHQSLVTETEKSEPSWILSLEPGPYIKELSHSIYVSLGGKVALLAVDCRTERTESEVVREKTWERIMNRMYSEIRRGQMEHLLLVLGTPIAYPRLVWLENILTSRLMGPVKALGKTGMLGKAMNDIDGGADARDDLNEHWTAKKHKQERSLVIEDLQDLAIDKSLRITILSGDVHMAAVGQFFSSPKLGLPKHKDPRYMPNVIASPMANAPPSDFMADVINKRNKVHHFDKQTDENMIPLFRHGVDGKVRNNPHLLPHRNWCSISLWTPGSTPPPTPPRSSYEERHSPSPHANSSGGLLRRLSSRRKSAPRRIEGAHESVRGPRPPISGGMGFFQNISRRLSWSDGQGLTRTMSLGRGEGRDRGYLNYAYRNSESQPGADEADLHGQWHTDDYEGLGPAPARTPLRPSGLRGGALHDEYKEDDESYFSASHPARLAQTMDSLPAATTHRADSPPRRAFHRTPTNLSAKQLRQSERFQVDVEGALEVVLNIEVSPRDPAGITVPYRLLVPRLQYEYNPSEDDIALKEQAEGSALKRLLGLGKRTEKVRCYELEGAETDEAVHG
ncbi:hypothetical protein CDD81_6327 [Ophiocordyceps australis]|uniref:PhoD-like phosphatase domain-containing protein n=1 Tax=Ophiocordyceps australis TaxID=1399860 RepID=A0A2C5Y754_9HYPO|nr:hypothetical protein CDD81_6327 [Ophiocordyceps australis]